MNDVILITGGSSGYGLATAARFAREGEKVIITGRNEEKLAQAAKETGAIVTAENHQVSCGLGSAIANVLAQNCLVPQEFVGIQNRYGQVGPQDFLEKEYNLMPEDIVAAVKKVLARK